MVCDKCGRTTHRDDAENSRCNGCEHLVRQCICLPEEIKVGDKVISEKWKVEGVVEEIRPCELCDQPALRLKDDGVSFRFHTDSFKKVK